MSIKHFVPSVLCLMGAILVSFDAPAATLQPQLDITKEVTLSMLPVWPLLLIGALSVLSVIKKDNDEE